MLHKNLAASRFFSQRCIAVPASILWLKSLVEMRGVLLFTLKSCHTGANAIASENTQSLSTDFACWRRNTKRLRRLSAAIWPGVAIGWQPTSVSVVVCRKQLKVFSSLPQLCFSSNGSYRSQTYAGSSTLPDPECHQVQFPEAKRCQERCHEQCPKLCELRIQRAVRYLLSTLADKRASASVQDLRSQKVSREQTKSEAARQARIQGCVRIQCQPNDKNRFNSHLVSFLPLCATS